MTRLVFGRDRDPGAWTPVAYPAECRGGYHLVCELLARCTICGWLDPLVTRCATQGCIYPATWGMEVEHIPSGRLLGGAPTCRRHLAGTAAALIQPGPIS